MLKKIMYSTIIIITALQCSKSAPSAIPTGSWQYKLYMNGVAMGRATVSNEFKDGNYISTMEMTMQMGQVQNTARQVIVETPAFKPVKLEIVNTVNNAGSEEKITTTAIFSGREVTVKSGDTSSTVTIDREFVLDGNYFMAGMLKNKFQKDSQVSAYIYDPTFELEEPVRVIAKVIGEEKIEVNGKTIPVIHIVQAIENFKNIDVYIDDNGVTVKTVILMLNNKIELIKD